MIEKQGGIMGTVRIMGTVLLIHFTSDIRRRQQEVYIVGSTTNSANTTTSLLDLL
jgi:hypothetical protein